MFIGHFAVGLAASRIEKRLPLGTALVASQLPDALWPYFLLAGAETVAIAPGDIAMTPLRFESYPWSHSLLMVAVWGVLASLAYRTAGRPSRAAWFLAPLALSHWVLDFITHRPDMPLVPWGGAKVGLGMWNSVPLTNLIPRDTIRLQPRQKSWVAISEPVLPHKHVFDFNARSLLTKPIARNPQHAIIPAARKTLEGMK